MMKLYDGGKAPNPRRVEIFLKEKNLIVEKVPISIAELENRGPEFEIKNPLKKLPVLELEDGRMLCESVAICRFIESIQPEPKLMGTDDWDVANVEMWQRRVELYYFYPVMHSFRHIHPAGAALEGEQVLRWGEINQKRSLEFMEFLDDELSNRTYIACEQFTIADITAICAAQFLKPARIAFPENLANFKRWFDAVAARPSCEL